MHSGEQGLVVTISDKPQLMLKIRWQQNHFVLDVGMVISLVETCTLFDVSLDLPPLPPSLENPPQW